MINEDNDFVTQIDGCCKFHCNFLVTTLCDCGEFLCEKCLSEDECHSKHSPHYYLGIAETILNFKETMKMFIMNINKKVGESYLKEYQDEKNEAKEKAFFNSKMANYQQIIGSFFDKEKETLIQCTNDYITFLQEKQKDMIELLNYTQKETEESLQEIKSHYDIYKGLSNQMVNQYNKLVQNYSKMTMGERYNEIREFVNVTMKIEKGIQQIKNTNSLLSKERLKEEFSLTSYYAFIDNTTKIINEKFDYSNISDLLEKKISNKIQQIFQGAKTCIGYNILDFTLHKSYLYYPIDNSCDVIKYDFDNETFHKYNIKETYQINIKKFSSFNSFARSINVFNKLYISGGFLPIDSNNYSNQCKYSSIVYCLDESNNTSSFTKKENMIKPRAGHSLLAMTPNLIYAFGGLGSNNTCEMFNIAQNKWFQIASLNEQRIDAVPFIANEFIYLFGGLELNDVTNKSQFKHSIERIKFKDLYTSDKWSYFNVEEMNENYNRSMCGVIYKSSTVILIIGGQKPIEGQKSVGEYCDDIIEFDIDNNQIKFLREKLNKPTAFIDSNFSNRWRNAVGYDIYGDLWFYDNESQTIRNQYNTLS